MDTRLKLHVSNAICDQNVSLLMDPAEAKQNSKLFSVSDRPVLSYVAPCRCHHSATPIDGLPFHNLLHELFHQRSPPEIKPCKHRYHSWNHVGYTTLSQMKLRLERFAKSQKNRSSKWIIHAQIMKVYPQTRKWHQGRDPESRLRKVIQGDNSESRLQRVLDPESERGSEWNPESTIRKEIQEENSRHWTSPKS